LDSHPEIVSWVRRAYDAFQTLLTSGESGAIHRELDQVAMEFDNACLAFSDVIRFEQKNFVQRRFSELGLCQTSDVNNRVRKFETRLRAAEERQKEAVQRDAGRSEQVEQVDNRVHELETRLRAAEARQQEANERDAIRGKQLEQWQDAIDQQQQRINDLPREVAGEVGIISTQLEELQAEFLQLQAEAVKQAEFLKLQKDVNGQAEFASIIGRQVNEDRPQIEHLQAGAAKQAAQLQAVQEEVRGCGEKIANLARTASRQTGDRAELRGRLNKYTTNLDKLHRALAHEVGRLDALSLRLESLEQNARGHGLRSAARRLRPITKPLERCARMLRDQAAAFPPWRWLRKLRGTLRLRLYRKRLRTSGLVDAVWYLQKYPEVAEAGMDPVKHYLRRGAEQGYDPNPYFHTNWYLERYPYVAASQENPLVHYVRRGTAQGNDPSPRFHTKQYLQQHPELARGRVNPLAHFLQQLRKAPEKQPDPGPSGRNGENVTDAGTNSPGPAASSRQAPVPVFEPEQRFEIADPAVKLIAFYLPQFHPIPENDAWWGRGFTEWTNVTRATPLFDGHHQPQLPIDLGLYDLRFPEVMQAQVDLARQYGIHGFCFYYYWFAGKRLLERPVDMLLANPQWDLPFCLCWANENWTRRWDGLDHEVLIAQQHSPEDDLACIEDLARYIRDPRYIRVADKPLVMVYRASLLPDSRGTAQRWRDYCRRAGIGEIFLCAPRIFGLDDPRDHGLDGALGFPPNGALQHTALTDVPGLCADFQGQIFNYPETCRLNPPANTEFPFFEAVFPAWDNTPRRAKSATIFANSSPASYEQWLDQAVHHTAGKSDPEQRLVFINAWNEWAEGAHLEPDTQWGYAYLNATARVLTRNSAASARLPVERPNAPVTSGARGAQPPLSVNRLPDRHNAGADPPDGLPSVRSGRVVGDGDSDRPLHSPTTTEADASVPLLNAAPRTDKPAHIFHPAQRKTLAIVIHAFYEDVFDQLLHYLTSLNSIPFKAYVTCPHNMAQLFDNKLRNTGVDYSLLPVDNRGRDVLPFLKIMPTVINANHELVLKTHTKKSTHRQDGDMWRTDLFNKLLAEPAIVEGVEHLKANPQIGILGPKDHLYPMSYYWEANAARVTRWAARLGVGQERLQELHFVAGTMFLARMQSLIPLLDLPIGDDDFEVEAGQVDGTMAHAVERLFAASCFVSGLRTTCLDDVETQRDPGPSGGNGEKVTDTETDDPAPAEDVSSPRAPVPVFEPERRLPIAEPEVKLIAFYLPQYHPIPENDAWWGKGFTEWTNVTRAVPLFEGHHQPQLPGELGFYDLRVPDVMQRQVDLAKQYGIHGFCFYYYWFGGKRLLERPVDMLLANPQWDLPFCLCWANENWTRRWDGQDKEILIAQTHSADDDLACIADLTRYLNDPRYIRVDGRPLLIVYRADILPEPRATAERWRESCAKAGAGNPLLVAAQTFGIDDPCPYGFDAAVQFPPHGLVTDEITPSMPGLVDGFTGKIYDFTSIPDKNPPQKTAYIQYRSVCTSWDNTARRGTRSDVYAGSTPASYTRWLQQAVDFTRKHNEPQHRFVFVNAWNEWAEGAHLEPDRRWGYAYLNATADVLARTVPAAPQAEPKDEVRDRVSVVIPAYNHEQFVVDALDSVRNQVLDGIDLEVVVVDDGSTDSTAHKCEQYLGQYPQLNARLIRQANAGAHATINRGILESTGDYVTILNSDDQFLPHRIQTLYNTLRSSGQELAFSDIEVIDDNSCNVPVTHPYVAHLRQAMKQADAQPSLGYALLTFNSAISTGNLFFTRRLYDRIGGFSDLKYCHDWDFLVSALQYTSPVRVGERLYRYRLHATNTISELNAEAANRESRYVLHKVAEGVLNATSPDSYPLLNQPNTYLFDLLNRLGHAYPDKQRADAA
jgi:lipopolysaccharide biosynthesis protein